MRWLGGCGAPDGRRRVLARCLPQVLLGVGALLVAGVAAALLVRPGGERPAGGLPEASAPSETAPAPPPPAPEPPTPPAPEPPPATAPSPPPAAGPAIADLRVASLSPFSARVVWQTGVPTTGWVAAGPPDGGPLLWLAPSGPARRHEAALGGLAFGTAYRVWVTAVAGDGRRVQATVDLTTPGLPPAPSATVASGAIHLDGEPFFPLMVWGQCPDTYGTSLPVGMNLFARNPCGGLEAQLPALGGRALSAAVAGESGAGGTGVIGFFYPDEPDGHGLTGRTLPAPPPGVPDLAFVTLTSHFYSGAAPLPGGRRMYPGLIVRADVVGFDLYPLQAWCRPDRLADVYAAQRELVRLAGGRPTFQWIEAAGMRCPEGQTAVTPETVRAEAWLAIAGGARGLGFFPVAWTGDVGAAIADVARTISYLGPALLAPAVEAAVEPAEGPVKAGARAHNGALYVIAVNAGYAPARATIRVPDLDGRPLAVLGEGRTVVPDGNAFAEALPPLAARVYVAAPVGS